MNYRIVFLDKWITPFFVPRYITRVDIDKEFNRGTHGWQVRYFNSPSRFFSDTRNGVIRTPYDSLEDAIKYLSEHYVGFKPRSRNPKPKLVLLPQNKKTTKAYYLTISHPKRNKSSIKVYVGTENTYSQERHKVALGTLLKRRADIVNKHNKEMKEKHGIK